MKKLRLIFDYGTFPVWQLDEKGICCAQSLPEELLNDSDLEKIFNEIESLYEQLFINTSTDFEYIGFKSAEEKKLFCSLVHKAVEQITQKTLGMYEIINDFHLEEL